MRVCCHANQRHDKWRGPQWDRFGSESFKTPFCCSSQPACCWWTVLYSSERSLSPSDAELSSPEPTACCDRHITAEEEDEGLEQEEISENGQEVSEAKPLCGEQQTSIMTLFHMGTDKNVTPKPMFMQEHNIIFTKNNNPKEDIISRLLEKVCVGVPCIFLAFFWALFTCANTHCSK